MKNSYTEDRGGFNNYDSDDEVFFTEEDKPTLFHVGQSYEETPSKKLICKHCLSDKFYVGKSSYFTAIKCVDCKQEQCVHEEKL